jgi:4-hydroxythreonine-4-phosphate dehydrogenase
LSGQYEKYDAVIATYHDQGLIPFKTLSFGNGELYGRLSKIRTSRSQYGHDIAGKVADHNSFKEAVYLALDIYRSRINMQKSAKSH